MLEESSTHYNDFVQSSLKETEDKKIKRKSHATSQKI